MKLLRIRSSSLDPSGTLNFSKHSSNGIYPFTLILEPYKLSPSPAIYGFPDWQNLYLSFFSSVYTFIIRVFRNKIFYHRWMFNSVFVFKDSSPPFSWFPRYSFLKQTIIFRYNTLHTLRHSTLIIHISRQSKEIAIWSILSFIHSLHPYRTYSIQIKVFESITSVHLPNSLMRHLHEQFLSPRSICRWIMFLLTWQLSLIILYSSSSHSTSTQLCLIHLHRIPIRSLRSADSLCYRIPQTTGFIWSLIRYIQYLLW